MLCYIRGAVFCACEDDSPASNVGSADYSRLLTLLLFAVECHCQTRIRAKTEKNNVHFRKDKEANPFKNPEITSTSMENL